VPHLDTLLEPPGLAWVQPPHSIVLWHVALKILVRASPQTCICGLSRGEGIRCPWLAAFRLPSVCLVSRPVGVVAWHMYLGPTSGWFSFLRPLVQAMRLYRLGWFVMMACVILCYNALQDALHFPVGLCWMLP